MKLNVKRTIFVGLAFMIISLFWGFYDTDISYILGVEFDLDPLVFSFSRQYPMMFYKIHCSIDPELTVEYRNYNGAPLLTGFIAKDQTRILGVEAVNIPKRESGNWMSPKRQFPFIKMYIMNNQRGSLVYKPKSARIGVYCGLPANSYYQDISNVLTDMTEVLTKDIVLDAIDYAENYKKAVLTAIET